jgi:hypothetical protein
MREVSETIPKDGDKSYAKIRIRKTSEILIATLEERKT